MTLSSILNRQFSVRFVAVVTVFSLLLSAFPASFFVALAANTDAVGSVTVSVVPAPASPSGERVAISFSGTGTLNLAGWTLSDALAAPGALRHTFGAVSLTNFQTVVVCQQVADPACDIQMDSGGSNVWNDAGDTLSLKDEKGALVASITWTSSPGEGNARTTVASVNYVPVACTPQFSVAGPTSIRNVNSGDYFNSVNDALADCDTDNGDTIELLGNISIDKQVTISRPIVLDGNTFTISPTFSRTDNANNASIGIIDTTNVTIKDLVIDGTAGTNLHGINVYRSTGVSITDTTITNPKLTAVVVNGSNVTVNNLTTSGSQWHAINAMPGSGVTTPTVLTVNGVSVHGEALPIPHIFTDDTSKDVTINDTNNQYEVVFDGPNPQNTAVNARALRLKTLPPPPADAIISATKIVCTDESLLPNDGFTTITANTAAEFLASTPERTAGCRLQSDWKFQWAPGQLNVAVDNQGEQTAPWVTSTPTNAQGQTTMTVPMSTLGQNTFVSVREVMQLNHIPFNPSGVSAEFYCSGDAANFDNLEWIPDVRSGTTHHCVAFNVPVVEAPQCVNLLTNGSFENPVVTNSNLWDKFSSVAGWAITKVSGGDATTLELHRNWSGNQAAAGAQYAELDGDHSTKIAQTVATIDGATYELSWAFAARHDIAAQENQLAVSIDGVAVATEGPATGLAGLLPSSWKRTSYTFVADSSTDIAFADKGPSDSFGTFLDDAKLCLVKKPVPVATIVAEKIVCDSEAALPNWNNKPGGAPKITATTAADYVAQSNGACRLVPDWEFEWALPAKNNPGDSFIGPAGAGWTTSMKTNAEGKTTLKLSEEDIDGKKFVWMREVLKDGYIGFSHQTKRDNSNDKTAEFYCHTDGLNYDNYDRVDGIAVGNTYHCVAFNTAKEVPPPQCTLEITSSNKTVRDTFHLAVPTYVHQNWTDDITGATWIWSDYYVADPEVDTTHVFTETFTVTTPSAALLDIGADNWYRVYINDVLVLDRTDPDQENNFQDHTIKNDVNVLSYLKAAGENTLKVEVTNKGVRGNTKLQNPAGALFKLNVTGATDCTVTTKPKTPASLTITNPVADYDVVPRVAGFDFKATYNDDDDETTDAIQWAIRAGTCEAGTGTIAGNVDGKTDGSSFVGNSFTATLDTSSWVAGEYCFVVNPNEQTGETDLRATRWFTIAKLPPPPPPETYRIEGFKFEVVGGDTPDVPKAGWTIRLYDEESESLTPYLSTTTDKTGYYYFDVPAGEWRVEEAMPEGWEQVGVESNIKGAVVEDGYGFCRFELPYRFIAASVSNEEPNIPGEIIEGEFSVDSECDFFNQQEDIVPPPVDQCSNIEEIQITIPEGLVRGDNNSCVPPTIIDEDDTDGGRNGGTQVLSRSLPGQVLGATTLQCGMYLFDYMREGQSNKTFEVQKLQWFLIGQGYFIPVTGIFDTATDEAVRKFQMKYQADVLTPWFEAGIVPHNNPTGWVYQLTRWKINNIVCPGSEAMPTLLP